MSYDTYPLGKMSIMFLYASDSVRGHAVLGIRNIGYIRMGHDGMVKSSPVKEFGIIDGVDLI